MGACGSSTSKAVLASSVARAAGAAGPTNAPRPGADQRAAARVLHHARQPLHAARAGRRGQAGARQAARLEVGAGASRRPRGRRHRRRARAARAASPARARAAAPGGVPGRGGGARAANGVGRRARGRRGVARVARGEPPRPARRAAGPHRRPHPQGPGREAAAAAGRLGPGEYKHSCVQAPPRARGHLLRLGVHLPAPEGGRRQHRDREDGRRGGGLPRGARVDADLVRAPEALRHPRDRPARALRRHRRAVRRAGLADGRAGVGKRRQAQLHQLLADAVRRGHRR
mmetsp:Transcript_5559/g.15672  ORF Transcript_5559/g.15672 Transcript_5559/m.15672 type:complete len:287 (+) Transcript_5559:13-873(+)